MFEQRRWRMLWFAVGVIGSMVLIAMTTGCSTGVQGESGRLFGFEAGVGVSVGEESAAQFKTTSGDETEAGRSITEQDAPSPGGGRTTPAADGRKQTWDTRF